MITNKELEKVRVKIRSSTTGREVIKVVYLGKVSGFHFGKVIEAKPRYVTSTGKEFPYPKWKHCVYRIEDQDGDTFTVSDDGITFYEGFYPVPDSFELGSLFDSEDEIDDRI